MSETTTCSYTHELADETWACPHPTDGGDLCLFHRPVDGKDDDRVARALLERADGEGRRKKEFVGARFGDLTLSFARLDAPDNYPVSLVDAAVAGDLTLTSAAVTQPLVLDGLSVEGDVHAENLTASQEVIAAGTTVDGHVDFQGLTIEDRGRFEGSTFGGTTNFHAAAFDEDVSFDGATFEGPADFGSADFRAEASFRGVRFEGAVDFAACDVDGEARFDALSARGDLSFRDATFGASVRFGDPDASRANLEGGASSDEREREAFEFEGVMEHVHRRAGDEVDPVGDADRPGFEGTVDFADAEFDEEVVFADVAFDRPPTFAGATFRDPLTIADPSTGGREVAVDLTDARVAGGRLGQPPEGRIVYDLTGATLGDVEIEGGSETAFEHCRFLHTTFDGFDFGEYRDSLAATDFRIHTVAEGPEGGPPDDRDPSVGDLEATYLKAKNGADAVGDNRAAAEFYRKELIFRRRGHASRATGGDGVLGRAIAAGKWTANLLHDLSCGYGERPSRVVLFALAVIVGFAPVYFVIYPGSGHPYPSMPLFGYVVVSFESFATLIHGGGPTLRGPLFRFVTEIEAFFGAFISGLFVFALTRSINR